MTDDPPIHGTCSDCKHYDPEHPLKERGLGYCRNDTYTTAQGLLTVTPVKSGCFLWDANND